MISYTIDLEKQLEYFDSSAHIYIRSLQMSLAMPSFRDEVLKAARERLVSGFEIYGDEMFTWDDKTARENIIEELADAVNYMLSREENIAKTLESVGTLSD